MQRIHPSGHSRSKLAVHHNQYIMRKSLANLYYIHDPMCSWCWGFCNVWQQLQAELTGIVNIKYILGGLAPDSNQAMPAQMRQTIENTWQQIQQEIPGTNFNFDFWTKNEPKRSTYPACRAIIAARKQQTETAEKMLLAIQQAYYLYAKNPSDIDVLVSLAEKTGLDKTLFLSDINAEWCQKALLKEINFCREIGVYSFPSLVLETEKTRVLLNIDYNDFRPMFDQITQ
jgi:putative protein-disulfide isomerase